MKRIYSTTAYKLGIGYKDESEEIKIAKADEYLIGMIESLNFIKKDDYIDDNTKMHLYKGIHDAIRNRCNLPNKVFSIAYTMNDDNEITNPELVLFDVEPNDGIVYRVCFDEDNQTWFVEIDD